MDKKDIRISAASETLERFARVQKNHPSREATLAWLLDSADAHEQATSGAAVSMADIMTALGCTDEERQVIHEAVSAYHLPWQRLFHLALMAECKHRVKAAEKMKDLDLSDPKARQHVRGASFGLCRQILDKLIAANEAAPALDQRRYITRSLIENLAGCSPAMAMKFGKECADEIDAHNRAMGFANAEAGRRHNQWVYKGPKVAKILGKQHAEELERDSTAIEYANANVDSPTKKVDREEEKSEA